MTTFIRQSREIVHDAGFIKLVTDTVHESTTDETFTRVCIAHIGAVMVLPVFDNGELMLIKQYRASINEDSLEVVAGRKDVEGESPDVCAARELKEELGISAKTFVPMGTWVSSPGFTDEQISGFLALECSEPHDAEPDGIEERFSVPLRLTFSQAFELIEHDKIVDAKSVLMIYRAALHLGILSS